MNLSAATLILRTCVIVTNNWFSNTNCDLEFTPGLTETQNIDGVFFLFASVSAIFSASVSLFVSLYQSLYQSHALLLDKLPPKEVCDVIICISS